MLKLYDSNKHINWVCILNHSWEALQLQGRITASQETLESRVVQHLIVPNFLEGVWDKKCLRVKNIFLKSLELVVLWQMLVRSVRLLRVSFPSVAILVQQHKSKLPDKKAAKTQSAWVTWKNTINNEKTKKKRWKMRKTKSKTQWWKCLRDSPEKIPGVLSFNVKKIKEPELIFFFFIFYFFLNCLFVFS